jgi:hypothetical protein
MFGLPEETEETRGLEGKGEERKGRPFQRRWHQHKLCRHECEEQTCKSSQLDIAGYRSEDLIRGKQDKEQEDRAGGRVMASEEKVGEMGEVYGALGRLNLKLREKRRETKSHDHSPP